MLKNTIIVSFTAPEHSGKTALEVAFAKFLSDYGIKVMLPPDPQRDEKMNHPLDDLMHKFREKGVTVMIMESNAS